MTSECLLTEVLGQVGFIPHQIPRTSATPVVQSNFAGCSTLSAGVHVQRLLKGTEHKEDDNIVQGEKKKNKSALASSRTAALEEDFKNKMEE